MKKFLIITYLLFCSSCVLLQGSAAFESALKNAPWHQKAKNKHPPQLKQTKKEIKRKYKFRDADPEVEAVIAQGAKNMGIEVPILTFQSFSDKLEGRLYKAPYNGFNMDFIVYNPRASQVAGNSQYLKAVLYHELAHLKNSKEEHKTYQQHSIRHYTRLVNSVLTGILVGTYSYLMSSKLKISAFACATVLINSLLIRHSKDLQVKASHICEREADATAIQCLLQQEEYRSVIQRILQRNFAGQENKRNNEMSMHPADYEREQAAWDALKDSDIIWTTELYNQALGDLENDPHKEIKKKRLDQMHLHFMQNQHGQAILPRARLHAKDKMFWKQRVLDGTLRGSVYANAWWRQ